MLNTVSDFHHAIIMAKRLCITISSQFTDLENLWRKKCSKYVCYGFGFFSWRMSQTRDMSVATISEREDQKIKGNQVTH